MWCSVLLFIFARAQSIESNVLNEILIKQLIDTFADRNVLFVVDQDVFTDSLLQGLSESKTNIWSPSNSAKVLFNKSIFHIFITLALVRVGI